jgi:hypothetical protein
MVRRPGTYGQKATRKLPNPGPMEITATLRPETAQAKIEAPNCSSNCTCILEMYIEIVLVTQKAKEKSGLERFQADECLLPKLFTKAHLGSETLVQKEFASKYFAQQEPRLST